MRKLLIGAAIALPLSLIVAPASALPGATHDPAISGALTSDLVEVKHGRGRGWGRGGGWGRSHGLWSPPGWSRGRKVGWRGMGCPPGHWKKGWC